MRAFLLLVLAVLLALIVLYRDRIYVRDPLATVYKTDPPKDGRPAAPADRQNEVKQIGVEVYINYENDVLTVSNSPSGTSRTLVQNWSKMPGTPTVLRCLRWSACLTSDDHAPTFPMNWTGKGTYDPQVTMTATEVTFVDGNGAVIRVVFR